MLRVGPARATGTAGTTTAGSCHAGTPQGPGPASAVLYRGSLGAEGSTLALDVHKGQRLPWADHHRVRRRRARASELAPVDALDRDDQFVRRSQRLPQSSTFSRGSTGSGGGISRPR
jgi:hypothetical protein